MAAPFRSRRRGSVCHEPFPKSDAWWTVSLLVLNQCGYGPISLLTGRWDLMCEISRRYLIVGSPFLLIDFIRLYFAKRLVQSHYQFFAAVFEQLGRQSRPILIKNVFMLSKKMKKYTQKYCDSLINSAFRIEYSFETIYTPDRDQSVWSNEARSHWSLRKSWT